MSEPEDFKKKLWGHCRICDGAVLIRVGEEEAKYCLCPICKGKIARGLEKIEEIEKTLGM